ncbi:MAG: phosphatase PAP2 family protein [Chloroflexota bacterium]|nr:phosphatase PAP2 family protein [Chloroflexota bacterium]MDE3194667.1 phosphatase PAP2 family protein [Chloroflexota bacterium]
MSLARIAIAARRVPPWTASAVEACAAVFAVLAILVASGATRGLDLATIVLFQSVASYPLDLVANAHTLVGQLVVTLAIAAVLAAVIWRRYGGYAWLAPGLILVTGAVELAFKLLVPHPSPPREFVRAFHNVLGIEGPPASFPSGHVARIAFLAVIVAAIVPGRVSVIVAATFIAASVFLRVYIGDHWISDAVAGAALGVGLGAVGAAWMRATASR